MIRRAARSFARRRNQRKLVSWRMLSALRTQAPQATFVEIGANDGDQHDHLKEFVHSTEWCGVMVEPVAHLYDRLVATHGRNPRIALERAVISDVNGTVPFFYVEPPSEQDLNWLPAWYEGLGSLSRDTVLSHRSRIPDIEDRLVCRELPSLTVDSLCHKHGLDRFDLLVTDTEGYDADLLRTVDFDRYTPDLLIYEHFHLTPGDRRECREMLAGYGYWTMEEGLDTLGLRASSPRQLRDIWTRSRPASPGLYTEDFYGSSVAGN